MSDDATPEELVQLRRELNARVLRFRADGQACIGDCEPNVQSQVGTAIRSFEGTLYRASGYFHLFSNIEFRYPEIAVHEVAIWRMIRDASDRYARAANRRVQEAGFSQRQARPWSGAGGDAYAAHLPDQEAAARAMQAFAASVMTLLIDSKQWFQGVLNSLRALGFGIRSAAAGVTSSMTTLPRPIPFNAGVGFALGVQAWIDGTLPLFDGYQTQISRFRYNLEQNMKDVEHLISTPDNAFPAGRWPDPTVRRPVMRGVTERPTFPHVYADEHSVDISTTDIGDTSGPGR